MSFDNESFIMGYENGKNRSVVITGDITCTDANSDGNIVITEEE